jgi:hypothetical protein
MRKIPDAFPGNLRKQYQDKGPARGRGKGGFFICPLKAGYAWRWGLGKGHGLLIQGHLPARAVSSTQDLDAWVQGQTTTKGGSPAARNNFLSPRCGNRVRAGGTPNPTKSDEAHSYMTC